MNCLTWSSAVRIAALGLMLAGCGEATLATDAGVDASPEPDAAPDPCQGEVALDNAWGCMIDAFCGVVSDCYGDFLTVEECRELDFEVLELSSVYGDTLLASAIEQGTVRYDGAALGECLASLEGATCEDFFADDSSPLATCLPYIGTVPPDGACYLDQECMVPGSRCQATNCNEEQLCCLGTCVAPASIGDDCTTRPCIDGAHCVEGTCLAGNVDDRCVNDGDCDNANWCDNGVCKADLPTGGTCTDDDMCTLPEVCIGDDLDGATTGVCGRSSRTGDPCDGTCAVFTSHWCDQPDPTALGTCKPRVGEGEDCDPERSSCYFGHRCDTETLTCVAPGGLGASCEGTFDCDFSAGLYCSTAIEGGETGVCDGRRPDGQPCADEDHCVSGYCVQGVCTPVSGCY